MRTKLLIAIIFLLLPLTAYAGQNIYSPDGTPVYVDSLKFDNEIITVIYDGDKVIKGHVSKIQEIADKILLESQHRDISPKTAVKKPVSRIKERTASLQPTVPVAKKAKKPIPALFRIIVHDHPFWLVLLIVNIPLYLGLGALLFGSWSGFWECIKFWIKPDFFSFLSGEYWKDYWSEFKLFIFMALSGAAVFFEYKYIMDNYPWIIKKVTEFL